MNKLTFIIPTLTSCLESAELKIKTTSLLFVWALGLTNSKITTAGVRKKPSQRIRRNIFEQTSELLREAFSSVDEGRDSTRLSVCSVASMVQKCLASSSGSMSYVDSYIHLLQDCVSVKSLDNGMLIHDHFIRDEVDIGPALWKTLLSMYHNIGGFKDAYHTFISMQDRDVQSWNIMISCYMKHGRTKDAIKLLNEMKLNDMPLDVTFLNLLKICTKLEDVRLVHTHMMKLISRLNVYLESALVDMYAKFGSIDDACKVFFRMEQRNTVSWSTMIAGFVLCGFNNEAFKTFHQMQMEDVQVNEVTFLNILKACIYMADIENVEMVHGQIIEKGHESALVVANALIDAYSKCGSTRSACNVFDKMHGRNIISWSTIIQAYAQCGCTQDVFELFSGMEKAGINPNSTTFSIVIKMCASKKLLDYGKHIHTCFTRYQIKDAIVVENSLIDMYIKCGDVKSARLVFDNMQLRDVISWSTIIGAYAIEDPDEAFEMFGMMINVKVRPNEVTFISLLQACANSATLEKGRRIHDHLIRDSLEVHLFLGNTLIDMYCKGGTVRDARGVFNRMRKRDLVSWNALLAGYCQNGHSAEAFALFKTMTKEPLKPDHVTFLSLISVCRHVGLLEEGRYYFNIMTREHHIKPNAEHCACMVDLLGRAGRLNEALTLVNKLSINSVMVWMALLGACRISDDVKIAEIATESILRLEPKNTAACVMLSNIYAGSGRVVEKKDLKLRKTK